MGDIIKEKNVLKKSIPKEKSGNKVEVKNQKKLPGKIRGSHEVRRATTRLKVLDAGIEILGELGFPAATTTLVAKKAGVSRGALLHQFPTHCDLMLAIVEHIIFKNQQRNTQALAQLEPGEAQFKGLTDSLWEKAQTPDIIALIEIHMASRSNPDLAKGLGWSIEALLRTEFEQAVFLGKEAGIDDRRAVYALSTLTMASVWGLSIMRMNLWKDDEINDAFDLVKSNLDSFISHHKNS